MSSKKHVRHGKSSRTSMWRYALWMSSVKKYFSPSSFAKMSSTWNGIGYWSVLASQLFEPSWCTWKTSPSSSDFSNIYTAFWSTADFEKQTASIWPFFLHDVHLMPWLCTFITLDDNRSVISCFFFVLFTLSNSKAKKVSLLSSELFDVP